MKRLLTTILTFALLIGSTSIALSGWFTANQATVSWNPVTMTTSDTPIPPEEISYKVFLSNATTDPNKTSPAEIASTPDSSCIITLNVEGRFYVGVQAIRTVDSEIVGQSVVSWSDDPLVVETTTFGLRYFIPPGQAKKLKIG